MLISMHPYFFQRTLPWFKFVPNISYGKSKKYEGKMNIESMPVPSTSQSIRLELEIHYKGSNSQPFTVHRWDVGFVHMQLLAHASWAFISGHPLEGRRIQSRAWPELSTYPLIQFVSTWFGMAQSSSGPWSIPAWGFTGSSCVVAVVLG